MRFSVVTPCVEKTYSVEVTSWVEVAAIKTGKFRGGRRILVGVFSSFKVEISVSSCLSSSEDEEADASSMSESDASAE